LSVATDIRPATAAAMPPSRGRLLIDQIGKNFLGPDGGAIAAIGSVSLDVAPGEFLAIVGPSGCGKSTLLQVIAGLMLPSSGTVRLGDQDVTGEPAHMVYLFQQYSKSLLPWMTVANNVMFAFRHRLKLSQAAALSRCRDYLAMVGLAEFGDHYPWQLSGGMQQRVSIARALSFEPALLLMDEPFGALDEMTRERLNLELLSIWQQLRSTVVFVTHSISEAVFLSTRVVVMSPRPGRIAGIVPIDLPYPRTVVTREEPRFFELVTQVRELLRLRGEHLLPEEAAAATGETS
jgi:NitT/TauT family transport system ATP-binding protein